VTNQRILKNIFSNWASLGVTVVIAFLVSPIIVHSLGNELYGVWSLIMSVTGYFTVLDFGVNTAIVRYISSSFAKDDHLQARKVYSTSMAIFAVIALCILIFSLIFGFFFQSVFRLYHIPQTYLYAVFLLSAIDLAFGLLCSVYTGSLSGLQEFTFINGSSILVNIVKSIAIVYLLRQGYGLLTLALLQLSASLVRGGCQYWRIKVGYKFLYFGRDYLTRETGRLIYSYSVYSFVIAISLKLLFYTDSLVIGAMIKVSEVTFYAIPSSLLDYLEKLVWAMIAVLVPLISAKEAMGEKEANSRLYILGTRCSILVAMPVIISLYFYGDDFIRIWMGPEIASRSEHVLKLLLIGFGFSTSQLIAHGILKGISMHRVLAYILTVEALVNLGMSIALAKPYGIEGVAFGTMVPLILATLSIIIYTCNLLELKVLNYFFKSYTGGFTGLILALIAVKYLGAQADSYFYVFLKSGLISIVFLSSALPLSFGLTLSKNLKKIFR
jgi:O-antigen/teichoic acid export membrane protein